MVRRFGSVARLVRKLDEDPSETPLDDLIDPYPDEPVETFTEMYAGFLRVVFYLGLISMLGSPALFMRGGYWMGWFFFAAVFAWGVLVSALGTAAKPRSKFAVWCLIVNSLLFVGFTGFAIWRHKLERWVLSRRADIEQAREEEQARRRAQLLHAVRAGEPELVKKLLLAEPPLHVGKSLAWRETLCPPDRRAAHVELLRLMGERGAPMGGDLLVEAARCSLTAVQSVIRLGIAPTARARDGRTGLMTATSLDTLDFLLRAGVKVNGRTADGATALMFHRSAAVTQFLLDRGANPTLVDNYGRSALHYKYQGIYDVHARAQLAACYELLLKAGVDPNARDWTPDQLTPLLALEKDRWGENERKVWVQDAADMLVKYGADPLLLDAHRDSALSARISRCDDITPSLGWPGLDLAGRGGAHLLVEAIRIGCFRTVDALLAAGANPVAQDFDGVTPLREYLSRHPSEPDESLFKAATRFGWIPDAGP